VNVVVAALIIAAATSLAIGSLLFVRRTAPDGGYFNDSDRAAGIFGVLATAFFFLLGFIVFLAFASYDESRQGAETEALLVAQQFQTAQFMPSDSTVPLGGQLICYGRYVVEQEWPRMEDGSIGDELNPWGVAMFNQLSDVEPEASSEQSAYDKWFDQTSVREEARQDRLHGAEGIIPTPLWIVLLLAALLGIAFMHFFADSGERAVVQALQIGVVVALMVSTLLLIRFFDRPFESGVGGIEPIAMERTLNILENELAGVGERGDVPCAQNGEPLEDGSQT
jgi:Protein of unknown function (DUF4239)